MYEIAKTNKFKKDISYYQDDQKVADRLKEALGHIANHAVLPRNYQDHILKGKFVGCRECHILPNLLLIYKINEKDKIVTLSYVGSHSDLFN